MSDLKITLSGLSLTQNDDSPALQITQKVSSNQKLNPQG